MKPTLPLFVMGREEVGAGNGAGRAEASCTPTQVLTEPHKGLGVDGRGRESKLTGGTEKGYLEVLRAQLGLLVENLRCSHSGKDGVSYLNYRHQQGGRRELGCCMGA